MSEIHKGHRERVKEELRKNNFSLENWPPHKIVEFMLFYAIPRADTNVIAHVLISRFGSLSGVLDAPYELLCEVDGVSRETATLIKFTSSLMKAYGTDSTAKINVIDNIQSAKDYMSGWFMGDSVECVFLAALGANGRVLFCKRIAEGSPETVGIAPAVVVKTALKADAVKVIIAHNHPHGICNPSSTDYHTTYMLHEELRRVDVELIDHIIIAPDGVSSMKEQGMMPKSRK